MANKSYTYEIRITGDARSAVLEMDKFNAATKKMGTASRQSVNQAGDSFDSLRRSASSSTKAAAAGMRDLERQAKDLRVTLKDAFYFTIGLVGIHAATDALRGLYDAAAQMQGIQTAYTSVFGDEGETQFDKVTEVANVLGLGLKELSRDYVKLAAAAKGTTLEGENVEKVFIAVATAARALNMSADDVNGSLRAIQQMASKGSVQAEELRGQLGERLPGAVQRMATALGKTQAELQKMLEQGLVSAAYALPLFADVLMRDFAEGAAVASRTAIAEMERVKTSMFLLAGEIGESGFMDAMAGLFRSVSSTLNFFRENVEEVTVVLKGLAIAGAVVAASRVFNKGFDLGAKRWVGLASALAGAASGVGVYQSALHTAAAATLRASSSAAALNGALAGNVASLYKMAGAFGTYQSAAGLAATATLRQVAALSTYQSAAGLAATATLRQVAASSTLVGTTSGLVSAYGRTNRAMQGFAVASGIAATSTLRQVHAAAQLAPGFMQAAAASSALTVQSQVLGKALRGVQAIGRGVLGIFGGWPGLLATAGIALYSVASASDETEGATVRLAKATKDLAEARGAMLPLMYQMAEAEKTLAEEKANALREQVRATEQANREATERLEGNLLNPANWYRALFKLGQDVAAPRKELRMLGEELNKAASALDNFRDAAFDEIKIKISAEGGFDDFMRAFTPDELARVGDAYEKLTEKNNPFIKLQNDMQEEMKLLVRMRNTIRDGEPVLSEDRFQEDSRKVADRYSDAVRKLQESMTADDRRAAEARRRAAEQAASKARAEAQRQAAEMEQMRGEAQRAFSEAFPIEGKRLELEQFASRMQELSAQLAELGTTPDAVIASKRDKLFGADPREMQQHTQMVLYLKDALLDMDALDDPFGAESQRALLKYEDTLTRLVETADDYNEAKALANALLEAELRMADPLAAAWDEYHRAAKWTAQDSAELMISSFETMEDSLASFIRTGKMDFTGFVDHILDEMARMTAKSIVSGITSTLLPGGPSIGGGGLTGALGTIMGGLFGGTMGGLFGAGAGTAAEASSFMTADFDKIGVDGIRGSLFHKGGVPAAAESSGSRTLPASVFANAPRFHTGIGPGEQAAVIRRDEGVFTPGQMANMASINAVRAAVGGAGGNTVTFAPQINVDARGAAPGAEAGIRRTVRDQMDESFRQYRSMDNGMRRSESQWGAQVAKAAQRGRRNA